MIGTPQNPIFRREYLMMARSRKALLAVLLLVVVLSLILYTLWPRSGVLSQFDSNEIFSVFLGANLALIILLVPAFTAAAITVERENQSFDLLFTTALTPFEILAGKLFSALGMVFSIVLLSAPVTAVCALSGGISVALLLKTYGIIFLATLVYALLGLAISAVCHRSFTSVVSTYLGIGVLAGATWLPSVLLSGLTDLDAVWRIVRSLSPFEALFALNHPARYEIEVGGVFATNTLRLYTVGMILLGGVFLLIFIVFVLRPTHTRKAKFQEQYSDFRTSVKRRLGFPFYLIDPLKRKNPIATWRNAVFVAELRSKLFGHPKFILRALAICIALSLGILILISFNFAAVLGPEQVRLAAVLFQFGLIILFAPLVSSGSITDERAAGTIVLLRMTPLSIWTIVVGKLKAAFMYVFIFLLSSVPVLCALAYLELESAYWRIGAWVGALLLCAFVFILTGLVSSTVMKTTAQATALSYTVAFLLSVVTFSVLLFGTRISPSVKAAVLTVNPLAGAIQITSEKWFADLPLLYGRTIWQNHLLLFAALAVVLLIAAVLRVGAMLRREHLS
ncbi:MAG: ABC transporter permease subunit [Candidatus Pacebacteria bacterium]|nr:ABC transporter permease subunit [Candidatus Paceibacterota bacterium]